MASAFQQRLRRAVSPFVDASDVAKLLLTLVFVLDCVGKQELDAFNHRQVHLCLSPQIIAIFCAKQAVSVHLVY